MAITITIDGNDRTDKVEFGSLLIDNILTRKRDKCSFIIVEHTGDTYIPKIGEEVVIEDNGTKIFGGIIKRFESKPSSYQIIHHKIECSDYTALLDRKLVPDTYTSQTVDAIITDLKDKYFPNAITINNVNAPITIDYVAFNYKPLAKVIEQLANTINYDWYIDYDKDLHFFAKEDKTAPFDINDDDGSYDYESLVVRKDNTQLRNTIIVRGGTYLGAQITVDRVADGQQNIIPTRYKFTDFEATLTGNPLNIGIDNINEPNDFDALYNFNEKILVFKEEDKPSNGAVVKVAGKPHLPVIVKYKSQEHIDATRSQELGSGVYEYLIEDKSINTKEGARQRAEAEVLAYAETLSEGEFTTETSGLVAGQSILINSASRSISETFIINKVTTTQRTKDNLLYEVSLITTRTMDLIDVLQRLLLESTEKIEILQNEVVDLVEGFPNETISLFETVDSSLLHNPQTETMTMTETFTAQSIDYDVEFVAGPWLPTDGGNEHFATATDAHWLLNDSAGNTTVTDRLGNYGGVSVNNTEDMSIEGFAGRAFDFNGTDDAITVSSLTVPTSGWTFAFWVKLEQETGELRSVITNGNYTTNGFRITFNTTRNLAFQVGNSGSTVSIFTGNLTLGQWHHVVATFATNDAALYRDGILVGTDTNCSMGVPTTDFRIGRASASATQFHRGQLFDVRYYESRLTDAQIRSIYATAKRVFITNGSRLGPDPT